jgi:hypothetical protein
MGIAASEATRAGEERARELAPLAVAAVLSTVPAVLTLVLVHGWLDAGVRDFTPSVWNDQLGYWHRIASFAAVGLDTGYYSPNESDPPFEPVRYGVHGPWFPAVYGTVAVLVGWGPATSIFVNMAVLALGFVAFAALAELDVRETIVAGALLAVFWPVLLYVPTASQESLHQGLAMTMAGLFVRAIRRGPQLSAVEKTGGVALVLAAGVLRYSWLLLVPCFILLLAERITRRRVAAVLGVTALLVVAAMRLTSAVQPPGQNAAVDSLSRLSDPWGGLTSFARSAWANFKVFLYPGALDATAPTFREHGSLDFTGVQSWQIVGLVVLVALALVALLTTRLRPPAAITAIQPREALLHLVNLGVMTVAAFALYIPNGYYRVLGAHLLLSLLVLVAFRHIAVVAVIAALNVVMLPSFRAGYEYWKPNFHLDQSVLAHERAAFSRLIGYDADAANPWCNTLLLPLELYDWRVTLIPPGIGISYVLGAEIPQPPKSRWLLLTDDPLSLGAKIDRQRLRPLGSFQAGKLYENPDSRCFRRPAA